MNKYLSCLSLFSICLSFSVQAREYPSLEHARQLHQDVAKVTHVEAVYDSIERRIPEQHCWTETIALRPQKHSAAPTIIGGIIGGVIGNEVGRGGDNKKIGAVVGSVLGMSIAKDIQTRQGYGNHKQAQHKQVERCESSHRISTEQVLSGYQVDYRYHGRNYSTFMRQHPGNKIRIEVGIRPIQTH